MPSGHLSVFYDDINIDCERAEKMILPFISGELTGEVATKFLHHVENCANCYEELETEYLLDVALDRLESGEAIDIHKEIKDKLRRAHIALRIHSRLVTIKRTIQMLAGFVLAFAALGVLLRFV